MIAVTRLDGSTLLVNAELIEFIEATPDTHLSLTSGKTIIVSESPEEVAQGVIEYKQKIACRPILVPEGE